MNIFSDILVQSFSHFTLKVYLFLFPALFTLTTIQSAFDQPLTSIATFAVTQKLCTFSTAFAAGMMISVSVLSLAQKGISMKDKYASAPMQVIIGLLLGAFFFIKTEKWVEKLNLDSNILTKGITKRSLLIFIAMFMHSVPEGVAIGTGFAMGDFGFGLTMAIAIGVHNIPEGIAVALPLKQEGLSTWRCAWAAILTSLPQAVVAPPACMLANFFEPYIAIGLGFAGGKSLL